MDPETASGGAATEYGPGAGIAVIEGVFSLPGEPARLEGPDAARAPWDLQALYAVLHSMLALDIDVKGPSVLAYAHDLVLPPEPPKTSRAKATG